MDSPNSKVRQSLQEIATLLYYLYDHYVKDGEFNEANTFKGIFSFMGDLNVLGNQISLVEVETVLRLSCGPNRASNGMTYEEFYACVRSIGCILYLGVAESSRRALHFFLTEKIIPLAQTWGSSLTFSSNISDIGNKSLLDGLFLFQYFLRLWFLQVVLQVPQWKMCSLQELWIHSLQKYPRGISVQALVDNFTFLGIFPEKVSHERFDRYINIVLSLRSSAGTLAADTTTLSFSDFVLVIYMAAGDMDPLETSLSAEETYHPGLHVLLQTAADAYLHASLQNWRQHESKQNKVLGVHHSVIYDNGENPLLAIGLSKSTIMWLCRQGNLIHSSDDISLVVDGIHDMGCGIVEDGDEYCAAKQKKMPNVPMVAATRIPSLLTHIGNIVMRQRRNKFDKDVFLPSPSLSAGSIIHRPDSGEAYLQSVVGSSELSSEASAISLICPGILFASGLPVPAVLQDLYCPQSDAILRCKSVIVRDIIKWITTAEHKENESTESTAGSRGNVENKEADGMSYDYSNMSVYDEVKNIPFHSLVDLFKKSGLIPLLMSVDMVESSACGVLDRTVYFEPNPYSRQGIGNILSQREAIEVIFSVSQVLFGGLAESFSVEYLSIVLHREHQADNSWSWVTGASVTIPYYFGRQMPKLCIADHADRFCCLLDLCDPSSWDQEIIQRLNISTSDGERTGSPSKKHKLSVKPGVTSDILATPSRLHLTGPKDEITISEHAMTGHMEAFSTKIASLLSRLLTTVNIYKFKHADIQHIPGPEELSFVQQMLVLLFIHFPVNDFALNPWDLGDIISQSTMADDSYIEDSKRDYTRLQLDMRFICTKFNMSGDMLEAYLEHILQFDLESVYRDESPLAVTFNSPLSLLLPHIENLLSFAALQLLKDGQNLLVWEFLRCTRGNFRNAFSTSSSDSRSHQNPFLHDLVCPFPTHHVFMYRSSELTVSWKGMKNWIILHGLNEEYCEQLFNALTKILGTPFLTYSCFVVFAVLTYSCSRHIDFGDNFVAAIRALLERINSDMDRVQKLLCTSANSLTLGEVFSSTVNPDDVNSAFIEVVERSLSHYNDICNSYSLKAKIRSGERDMSVDVLPADMPPRPPLTLIDAPRFVHFCKCLGVLGTATTISSVWTSFARVLEEAYLPSQRQGWDPSVVPPLPLQVSAPGVARILNGLNVGSVYNTAPLKAEFSTLPRHVVVMLTAVVPWLMGYADDIVCKAAFSAGNKHTGDAQKPPQTKPDKNPPLDDLLRYGGNRTISALDRCYPWTVEVYALLSEKEYFANEGTREPLLRNVCQFMSKAQIFSLGTVSVLMKASLCPRVRGCPPLLPKSSISFTNSTTHSTVAANGHDIGVSLPEFEEFIIRCAYSLWRKTGVANMKNIAGVEIYRCVKNALPMLEETALSVYCEHCRTSLMQSRNNAPIQKPRYLQSISDPQGVRNDFRTSTKPGGKTWGMDFLQPFFSLLEATIDISIERESVEKIIEQPMDKSKKTISTVQPSITTTPEKGRFRDDVLINPVGSPQVSVSNATSNGVTEILQSVETKSEEVLANILALRDAAVAANREFGDDDNDDEIVEAKNSEPTVTLKVRTTPSPAIATDISSTSLRIFDRRQSPSPAESPSTASIGLRHVTPVKLTHDSCCPNDSPVGTKHVPGRHHTPSPHRLQNIKILEGTKEALWPVFATYCSCGDSSDPGKLSGPNLFALLSKLDLLTDDTTIPDLGVLLHQISAHSLAQSFAVMSSFKNRKSDDDMSPLFSFEEFLVFLCVFSELRYNGTVDISLLDKDTTAFSRPHGAETDDFDGVSLEDWFDVWSDYMTKSSTFRRLLEECVLPPLQKSLVLASPEDARHRDEFRMLFSLEIMFNIESIGKSMSALFKVDQLELARLRAGARDPIVVALTRIKIVPQIVSEQEVMQLIADIMPRSALQRTQGSAAVYPYQRTSMCYPQWQWVISVIALKAVYASIRMGKSHHQPVGNLASLVGEVLTTLTDAMRT